MAEREKPSAELPASQSLDLAAPFRAAVLQAVRGYESEPMEEALRGALGTLGYQGLLQRVVAPLAEQIGELWRAGELLAAHEHFFTASVRQHLGDLARQYATPVSAPRIVISTPPGQLHELGAIMTATAAANLGWRVIYLGPSLPAREIAAAAVQRGASAVALSLVYPEDDPAIPTELEELAESLPPQIRLVVGGRAVSAYAETLTRIGAICVSRIADLGAHLDNIRRPKLSTE